MAQSHDIQLTHVGGRRIVPALSKGRYYGNTRWSSSGVCTDGSASRSQPVHLSADGWNLGGHMIFVFVFSSLFSQIIATTRTSQLN